MTPTADPTILYVNDEFLKTVSRPREALVGQKLFVAFPGNSEIEHDGVEVLRNSLIKVIASGEADHIKAQSYPIEVIAEDGVSHYEERFWNAVNTPIFDEKGALVCISHHTVDVTESVLTEKALLKTQAHFQKLTDSIDEGFCVIEMIFDDHHQPIDYIFHEVNPMFEIQTGLQHAIGKSIRDFVPEHEAYWFEIYGNVAKTGKSIRFENEAKGLNRWYDVYAYCVEGHDSNMVGVLFRDITLRKQQEEALRLSESRLKALIAATAEIVYCMNPDWTQLQPLEDRGTLQEIYEQHPNRLWLDKFIPVEDHELLHQAIDKAIQNKSIFELEHRVHRADESIGWVESRAVPRLNESGEIQEWIGAAKDITQRKQAEEELKKIGRRKDEFLAMLAHELRNPLAPIASAAGLLSFTNLGDEKVKQTSEIITRQVHHMTGLIDDLLDVSRVTKGLIALDQAKYDFNEIITSSIEQVKPLIEYRKHRLSVQTLPRPIFVMGDHKRLVQVISNVLNNAAKYTPEGGQILLKVESEKDIIKTTVSDNGIGMEADMLKQAFELFSQAERTSDRSQGGLGIGLALVKNLVELHGGNVTMSSAGIHQGSTVAIYLNEYIETRPQAGVAHHATEAHNTSAFKILVVDDNIDAAETLAMLLEMLGHTILVEHNPETAITRAKSEKPDICLLDIGLPGMDGNELASHLRAMPETANAIMIAITGYGRDQISLPENHLGFDHYFVKPVDADKLIELLNNIETHHN